MQVIINGAENYITIIGAGASSRTYYGDWGKSGKIYTQSDNVNITMQISEDWYSFPWQSLLVNGTSPTSYLNAWELLTSVTSTNPPPLPVLTIGQEYQGGIIFYIDGSGQHGYVRAVDADIPTIVTAYYESPPFTITGATGEALGTGRANTDILLNLATPSPLAINCTTYLGGGYNDWFLPSKDEMAIMYVNGQYLGDDFAAFTSTEFDLLNAYAIAPYFFGNGIPAPVNKDVTVSVVIPIRAF